MDNTYCCNVNSNDILTKLISLSTRKNLLEQRDMYLKYSPIYNDFIDSLLNVVKIDYEKIDCQTIDSVTLNKEMRDIENTYDKIETIAIHLSLQIQLLEKHGFTLLYLLPSDISVITLSFGDVGSHNTIYLLTNLTNIVPLSKNNSECLVLTYPLVYPFPKKVCAPELYNLNVLPFITHRSAIYYSLGLLCLSFFTNLSLNNLRDTPLFYFLERCLKKEPTERLCYFV